MTQKVPHWVYRVAAITVLVGLAVFAGGRITEETSSEQFALEHHPVRVMGTTCHLVAVPPQGKAAIANTALSEAEAALRQVEAQMSTWIDASFVSRLNRAPPGELFRVPPPILHVLSESRGLHNETKGAFDVTCRPLIELWRAAGESKTLPTASDISAARGASSWDDFTLTDEGVRKARGTARVDLGGVAKGYGIDRAVTAMLNAGATGGLVDVGGDVRVFGSPPRDAQWEIQLRDPRGGDATVATLVIEGGSVCTSGDYFRFIEIAGNRFSHIIDPRTSRPARGVRSATVVAPEALVADAWATALSVLGPEGLADLPKGVEALLIVGDQDALRAVGTKGFGTLLVEPLPYPTTFE